MQMNHIKYLRMYLILLHAAQVTEFKIVRKQYDIGAEGRQVGCQVLTIRWGLGTGDSSVLPTLIHRLASINPHNQTGHDVCPTAP